MKISLPYGFELRDYQVPLWKATVVDGARNSCVVWPRRNGKDITTLNITVARAMQRVGMYLYVAPFYNQIRSIIWDAMDNEGRQFLDYIPKELIENKFDSRMTIEFKNGSILRFGGADNPDSLVGGNPIGIVRTEAAYHRQGSWDKLRPIILMNGGWSLHNSTPNGLNHFYTLADMAKNNKEWFFQHLTCLDTGYPTQEEIQKEREGGMLESMIQQEYYCNFLASSDFTLIPLELIQPCIGRQLIEDDYKHEPRLVGVDPAYSATGDKAVIIKRQGRLVHPPITMQGVDNMALADRVAFIIKAWKPHGVLVDSGRGEGVISRLGRLGYEDMVIPVHFGGGAYNSELYQNKRAEIWCRMRDWFLKGQQHGTWPSIPNDRRLITGLSTPLLQPNDRTGKMQVESKKEIRARGAYVMDEPDALAVTFAEDIAGDFTADGHYGRLREELEAMSLDDDDPNAGYDPFNFLNRGE